MAETGLPGEHDLSQHGFQNLGKIYWNLTQAELVEQIISRNEAQLSSCGAVIVETGSHTGRSPADKYVVRHHGSDEKEIWWGRVNQPMAAEQFKRLSSKARAYMQGRDVFVQDLRAGSSSKYQTSIRIISEKAWAALFSRNMLIELSPYEREHMPPQITIIHIPDFMADMAEDGTHSPTVIAIDFSEKSVLVCGTAYAGEIKKAVFTVMNYKLPHSGVLPMHCSANIGKNGDVSLFFGLSGTGKTTLSSDVDRILIGDDEHAWDEAGVFNIEGGCYAKVIHLRQELEPLIWKAVNRFGTVIENVSMDIRSREPDFDDDHRTENTRAAYPLSYIPNCFNGSHATHPSNIFFLSADAFGVLPPIARLSPEQAMYYFLSGYTSRLAGTEAGLGMEPQATFSACFGAPFLPLHPLRYAEMLAEKCRANQAAVWMVNTGWYGGSFGIGNRFPLRYTRAIIQAVHDQSINEIDFRQEDHFGLKIPVSLPDVPSSLLDPAASWLDKDLYAAQAKALRDKFAQNSKAYSGTFSGVERII